MAAGADAGAAGSDAQNYTALHGPSNKSIGIFESIRIIDIKNADRFFFRGSQAGGVDCSVLELSVNLCVRRCSLNPF